MKEDKKPIRSQKTKPYIIMQLIKKQADYDHLLSTAEIIDLLNEYGISAEQKSVQRDIQTINEMLMLEDYVLNGEEYDIKSIKEDVKAYKDIRSIQYRSAAVDHRGYYFQREEGYFEEIRLLLECINASKFISESSAKYLKQMILKDINIYDIERLEHITPITSRTRTNNKHIFDNVKALSDAIKAKCKVQFNYNVLYLPDGTGKPKERYGRKGAPYVVSPYHLLINDSSYYLLCYDEKHQDRWTYRVDRMENICLLEDEKRAGAESFVDFNAKEYAKTNFSMFAGKNQFITIKFDNRCLNAVFEKFGTDKITYEKFDGRYFTVYFFF